MGPQGQQVARAPPSGAGRPVMHRIVPFRCGGELSASIGAPTGSCVNGSRRSTVNNEAGPSRALSVQCYFPLWGLQSSVLYLI
jgi:hypothetical protein